MEWKYTLVFFVSGDRQDKVSWILILGNWWSNNIVPSYGLGTSLGLFKDESSGCTTEIDRANHFLAVTLDQGEIVDWLVVFISVSRHGNE